MAADCCFGYRDGLLDVPGHVASDDDVFYAIGDDPNFDSVFPLAGFDFLERMPLLR
jgi:hypothetical protein